MLWRCFAAGGTDPFHRIDDCRTLCEKINQHLKTLAKKLKLGHKWFLQMLNNPMHAAKLATKWLKDKIVSVLERPSSSLDLSSIENLWVEVKKQVGLQPWLCYTSSVRIGTKSQQTVTRLSDIMSFSVRYENYFRKNIFYKAREKNKKMISDKSNMGSKTWGSVNTTIDTVFWEKGFCSIYISHPQGNSLWWIDIFTNLIQKVDCIFDKTEYLRFFKRTILAPSFIHAHCTTNYSNQRPVC